MTGRILTLYDYFKLKEFFQVLEEVNAQTIDL